MKNSFLLIILFLSVLVSCNDEEKKEKIYLLDQSNILALAVDGSNTLWVGTDEGLYRQASTGFNRIETGADTLVTALAFESTSNSLWVGTMDGLYKLKTSNADQVERIDAENLRSQAVLSICINPGADTWFGTMPGLTRTDSGEWQIEKFKKNLSGTIGKLAFESFGVNSIAILGEDYYFATTGVRLYRASGWNEAVDAFTGATQWESPYNGMAISDTMFVVFIDSQGRQWMGGTIGVQVHAGTDPKVDNTSYYDELVNPRVHCVAESPDGDIWVGTENGISVFDGSNWQASEIVLPDPFVQAIHINSTGTIFIGTKKGLVIH
jgi:ligand-binding sensor domain-containing protein